MESLITTSRFIVTLTASPRVICNGSFYVKKKCNGERNFSSSARLRWIGGEDSPGSYTKGPTFQQIFKRIYNDPKLLIKLYKRWKDEFKLFGKEIRDTIYNSQIKGNEKGEIDMLFTFEEDADIEKFLVVTDKTNNQGYSTASFVRTQNETALFSGFVDTRVPDDGKTQFAGFAAILSKRLLKSFGRYDTHDFTDYTHLVMKVRGDGRSYCINLGCPDKLDVTYQDQFHYPLYTRGGPYWQIVKIPLSNFYLTNKGKIQDQQSVIPGRFCSRVGITMADGITGPFKLEIEYFGLEYQPYHKSICPYEHYADKGVVDP